MSGEISGTETASRYVFGGKSQLWLGIGLLTVLVVFAALLGFDLVSARQQTIDSALRDADNLSRVLERHVSASVDKIDVVLQVTAHDFAPSLTGQVALSVLDGNQALLRLEKTIPEAQPESLRVIDADGKVVYNAGSTENLPNVMVADRTYFLRQKNDPQAGLVISEPILSRFTGKWLFVLSRRMTYADGRYAGLVQSAIRADYVEAVFSGLNVGEHGNISLFDGEFRLAARQPALPDQLGKAFNLNEVRQGLARGQTTGTYSVASRVDSVFRHLTYRQVQGLPFLVIIGLSPQDFLHDWQSRAYLYAGVFVSLAVALISLFVILIQRARTQSRLAVTVFDKSMDGMLILDGNHGIVTANHAFCAMTGELAGQITGSSPIFLSAECMDRPIQDEIWDQVENTGHWRGEIRYRRHSGEIFSCWLSVSQLLGLADRSTFYLAAFSDISDLKAAEGKLRQLSRAVDQGSDMVLITDRNGIIEYVNGSFCQISGYQHDEAIGRTPGILRSQGTPVSLYQDLWSCLLDGRVWTGEFENCRKDGSTFWVSASISPIRNELGEITHFLGVESDIGLRKEIESRLISAKETAENADRTKSEFLATMSHEIRTPMNGIIGMCGLLLDTQLDQQQQRYANTVRQSAESLLTIINDVLDFSRIESGKLELEEAPFEIRDLVEGVIDILSPRVKGRPVQLIHRILVGSQGSYLGDGGRLRQILLNLVGNAVKFTERGHITVTAGILRQDDSDWLRIDVQDTGIGIPAEAQPKLFTMFTQADSSIARRHGGSGLGLAICRRIVDLMGGSIGMESQPGQGSTFWYQVPLKPAPDFSHTAQNDLPSLAGQRILLVDDDRMAAAHLVRLIEQTGAMGEAVHDVPNALTSLRQALNHGRPFTLIVVDQHLPGLTGMDLSTVLHTDPTFTGLPVILLSSDREQDDTLRAKFAAIVSHATPPADLIQIMAAACGLRPRIVPAQAEQHSGNNTTTRQDPAPTAASGTKLRILVVEDNAINQQVAVGLLTKLGHRADVANDGGEGVSLVERCDYDLVLMDMQMPNVDGIAATRMIRALDSAKSRVPIIAMTANAMAEDRERCLQAGMDDYLSKPIDRRRLSAMLDKWGAQLAHTQLPAAPVPAASVPAASVTETSAPVPSLDDAINREVLDDLLAALGHEVVAELLTIFSANMPQEISDLNTARQNGDLPQLGKVAHSIKGAALNLGLLGISNPAMAIEKSAKAGAWPPDDLYRQLEAGLPLTDALLQQINS